MPRYAQLLITGSLVEAWLRGDLARAAPCGNNLPEDAVLKGSYTAHPGIIGLIFEHPSFPEAPAGADAAMLPLLPDIVMRALRTPEIRPAAEAEACPPSRN